MRARSSGSRSSAGVAERGRGRRRAGPPSAARSGGRLARGRSRAAPRPRSARSSLGVVGALAFGALFTLFHELAFPAGNWAFDPATQRLVQLYPLGFWQVAAGRSGLLVVVHRRADLVARPRAAGRAHRTPTEDGHRDEDAPPRRLPRRHRRRPGSPGRRSSSSRSSPSLPLGVGAADRRRAGARRGRERRRALLAVVIVGL